MLSGERGNELGSQECILSWNQVVSDEIGQFTTRRMYGGKHQQSLICSASTFYHTLAAEERAPCGLACSSHIGSFYAQHDAITTGTDNGVERELNSFSK